MMIFIFIFIAAYLLGGLATYRHVGYALENGISRTNTETHEFRRICTTCRCKNCGDQWGHHFVYTSLGTNCRDYEQAPCVHARTIFAFVPVMILWWLIAAGYGVSQAGRAFGLSPSQRTFFTPAPKVLTKAEKQEQEILRREERLADLNAAIAAAEAENERQIARQKALGLEV